MHMPSMVAGYGTIAPTRIAAVGGVGINDNEIRKDPDPSNPNVGSGHSVTVTVRQQGQGTKGFVRANSGLLLVAAAQSFFAAMNAAVKTLHTVQPEKPVSALQVCYLSCYHVIMIVIEGG
jgi:hypothetical protein